MATERDRDQDGRARSARPRDELGRPLPYGTVGVAPLPEVALPPVPALTAAQRLLDQGLPFQAHEVLEGVWKSAPNVERDLWQGLAQLAVGLTHARRGNQAGATALWQRARDRIAGFAASPPYDIDVPGLLTWTEKSLSLLADGKPDAAYDPPRLRRA